MDITYQPGQAVPAGNYIVILRPVSNDESPINMPTPTAPPMNIPNYPPATVPEDADDILPPATVPNNNTENQGAQSDMGEEAAMGVSQNMNATQENIGSNSKNNSINNIGMQGGRKRMGKTKKAKKAKGTRKLSPYMKFAQQVRPQIIKNNPSLKSDIIGTGRKIGEMWRALSDAEKAKY